MVGQLIRTWVRMAVLWHHLHVLILVLLLQVIRLRVMVLLRGWFLDVLRVHCQREGRTLCYACRGTLVHEHGVHLNPLRAEGLLCEGAPFLRIGDEHSDRSLVLVGILRVFLD